MVILPPPSPLTEETEMQDRSTSQASFRVEELKGAFANLKGSQDQVLKLFASVAASLGDSPDIGPSHPLARKWEDIRQDYRAVVQESRRNASKCASLLSQYSLSLPHVLGPGMPIDEKTMIVGLFIEEAKKGQERATQIHEKFKDLGERVQDFPDAVKREQTPTGFWSQLWSKLKGLCKAAFDLIDGLARWLVDVFFWHGSSKYRFGQFSAEYIPLSAKSTPRAEAAGQTAVKVKEDCLDISGHLFGVAHVWREIEHSCDELTTVLKRADDVLGIPSLCSIFVEQAEVLYVPLIEKLREYSSGRIAPF